MSYLICDNYTLLQVMSRFDLSLGFGDKTVQDVYKRQAQEDVYQQALASRPEIQSSKLSIENSKLDISVAKAGYLPTISLSAWSFCTPYNQFIF